MENGSILRNATKPALFAFQSRFQSTKFNGFYCIHLTVSGLKFEHRNALLIFIYIQKFH